MLLMTVPTDLDPRIERTRRVVLESAAELLGECGFGRTSIEAISERSGVARSTIYRHWPDRNELLVQSILKRIETTEATDTGDLRADLISLYSQLGSMLNEEETRSVVSAFIAESSRDPELAALHSKFTKVRSDACRALISNAVARGDLPGGTDSAQMAHDLAGGIFFRGLVLRESTDGAWIATHVDRWISIYSSG